MSGIWVQENGISGLDSVILPQVFVIRVCNYYLYIWCHSLIFVCTYIYIQSKFESWNRSYILKNHLSLVISPRTMDWVALTTRIRWWFCLSLQQSWQALLEVGSLSQRPCHRRAKRCEMGQSKCRNMSKSLIQVMSSRNIVNVAITGPISQRHAHAPALCCTSVQFSWICWCRVPDSGQSGSNISNHCIEHERTWHKLAQQ